MTLPFALAPLLAPRSHRPQLDDHHHVEDQDEGQGTRKAEDERVESESCLLVYQIAFHKAPHALNPEDVTALSPAPLGLAGGGVEEDWEHEDGGEEPGGEVDHLGDEAGAEPWRGDGMADGDVAIRGEDHEEEGAGDLVDGGGGEVDLAHDGAEGPLPHEHGGDEERDADQEALVRHGEVEDVGVGHRVHLGEAENHVDHQGVTQQTGQADQRVENLRETER